MVERIMKVNLVKHLQEMMEIRLPNIRNDELHTVIAWLNNDLSHSEKIID